jgi:hypothetical protein
MNMIHYWAVERARKNPKRKKNTLYVQMQCSKKPYHEPAHSPCPSCKLSFQRYTSYALSFQHSTPVTLPTFPPSTTTLGPPILTTTPSLPHSSFALQTTFPSSLSTTPPCRPVPFSTPSISMAWTCSGRVLRSRDTSMGICIENALLDVEV